MLLYSFVCVAFFIDILVLILTFPGVVCNDTKTCVLSLRADYCLDSVAVVVLLSPQTVIFDFAMLHV